MPAPALRPRSATEIVDAAFQILRAHYAQFVMCSALAYIPFLILRLAVIGDPMRFLGRADPLQAQNGLYASTIIASLAGWLTFTLMSAVLLVCASDAYLGEEVDVGSAVRRALPRVLSVMVAAVLRYVAMAAALLAFVFPVFYVVARFFAVTPAIVLENAGVVQAFRRSGELSRRRKWHILNTLGLVAIIYWVVVVGLALVAALIGSFIVQTVITSVATVLVFPVVAITEALLYYDARIQSEGLDIELMTDALTTPGGAGSSAR
ncbi:MAG TPA: glycerophosphoryl diester phosphodiesterase membrane domain-containing protein [Gemmatimonadaceae bacterium]